MTEPTPVPDLLRAVEDAAELLDGDGTGAPAAVLDDAREPITGMERLRVLARIEGGASPGDDRRYVGRVITLTRRKAAASVAWYVQPALDRITRFHDALLGQIRTILLRLDAVDRRLDRDLAAVRAELAAVQARLDAVSGDEPAT